MSIIIIININNNNNIIIIIRPGDSYTRVLETRVLGTWGF